MDDLPQGGRTRLAPTPSGFLHAGNAINFLITQALARITGARLLLRIDDLDAARVRKAYIEDIFRSLEWLGIAWDEGPGSPDELRKQWSQQIRLPRYHAIVDTLREQGLLYGCTCSRSQLRHTSSDGRYPGTCRNKGLPLDAPQTAWRTVIADGTRIPIPALLGTVQDVDLAHSMGDPVLRGKDGQPSYQIASLADDNDGGITFIVRGLDLLPSSACQIHLAKQLGMEAFVRVRFLHHGLLLDPEGRKLSKSAGSDSLKAMREAGQPPDGLRRQADTALVGLLHPN